MLYRFEFLMHDGVGWGNVKVRLRFLGVERRRHDHDQESNNYNTARYSLNYDFIKVNYTAKKGITHYRTLYSDSDALMIVQLPETGSHRPSNRLAP
jgi:hypothetical protein